MRRGSLLAVLLVALLAGAATPDGVLPRAAPDAGTAAADAGAPSEDEEIIKELELLENLDVLERLEQVDVGD